MINRKVLYKGMLLLSSIGILAACGNGDEGATEDTTEDPTEETADETGDDTGEETTDAGDAAADEDVPEKPESLHMWVNSEDVQLDAYEELMKH